MNFKTIPLIAMIVAPISFNTFAQCDPSEKPPSDKPSNFDINEHLSKFTKTADAIKSMPPVPGMDPALSKRLASGLFLAAAFAPNQPYDLKNNPLYNSSQPDRFGNWFFGAAAGQLGFTKAQSQTAGAIVQQGQDFTNTQHPDYGDIGAMAYDIASALYHFDGTEDNSPDPADIGGGHDYQANAYENDTASGKSSGNSCDSNDSSDSADSGGGSISGFGGGWNGGGVYFMGFAGCYGACGGGAVGSVKITDLPNLKDD